MWRSPPLAAKTSGEPGSTVTARGHGSRPRWARGLFGRLAKALGLGDDRADFVVRDPAPDTRALGKLAARQDPKLQVGLLTEALDLLDGVDRELVERRLAHEPYETIAEALGLTPDRVGPRYGKAIERLVERLAWVSDAERRGVSKPERRALGQVLFFGRSAQEAARFLRLEEEVVERWVRLADFPNFPTGSWPGELS